MKNESVSAGYKHTEKVVTSRDLLELPISKLKWYDLAPVDESVPESIYDLATDFLHREFAAGELGELGEYGFVILHRCGHEFYFLLVSSWRKNNELWESVYAKVNDSALDFARFNVNTFHHPTFCVWELAAVMHEKDAWSHFLRSDRGPEAINKYLNSHYNGPA